MPPEPPSGKGPLLRKVPYLLRQNVERTLKGCEWLVFIVSFFYFSAGMCVLRINT